MTRTFAPHYWRILVVLVAAGAFLASVLIPMQISSSSHREAPLIATDPTADNTDLYAFVSAEDTVTIIANYIPLQEPAGGPNFSNFSDDVRYEIKVDNDGDATADVSYRFRFVTEIKDGAFGPTYLYNDGPITSLDDPNWLFRQTYSVTKIMDGRSRMVGSGVVPPTDIGPRSTPGYAALAASAVTTLSDGSLAFAGPRDDAFFVDLGSIFDLGGLRPFNGAHAIQPPSAAEAGVDGVGGFNVHTISLQIPITELTADGELHALNDGEEDDGAIIGVWATASRQRVTVLQNGDPKPSGPWIQVSRLGNPLINEVIIPLNSKDYWNSQAPHKDSQFVQYYDSPALAAIVNTLYPSLPDARTTGRADLVAILLTGLTLPDGIPFTATGTVQADMLRLNTAVPPCTSACNVLGVMGGDLAGFPNGRRLTDDVTDIELRAVADGYGSFINGIFGDLTPNNAPNNAVGDGVNANDVAFLPDFPYQASPHTGYVHEHHAVGSTTTPTPV